MFMSGRVLELVSSAVRSLVAWWEFTNFQDPEDVYSIFLLFFF
jgi:hypothetical protein